MEVAARLREALKTRGNQSRLAGMTGLSRPGLMKIANEDVINPGVKTVEKIERALDELDREAAVVAEGEAETAGAKGDGQDATVGVPA